MNVNEKSVSFINGVIKTLGSFFSGKMKLGQDSPRKSYSDK